MAAQQFRPAMSQIINPDRLSFYVLLILSVVGSQLNRLAACG